MPLIVVNGKLLLIVGFPSGKRGELLSLRSVEQLSQCPRGHGILLQADYLLPKIAAEWRHVPRQNIM